MLGHKLQYLWVNSKLPSEPKQFWADKDIHNNSNCASVGSPSPLYAEKRGFKAALPAAMESLRNDVE